MSPLMQDRDKETKSYLLSQFAPKLAGGLTSGSSEQIAPSPIASPTPPKALEAVPTNTGSQAEDRTDAGNLEKTADSFPAHKPEDLMGSQMAELDKYGPDQEKAVLDNILQSRNSIGNRLSRAGAGLGDAIMGVAGKSSPGFLNNLTERETSGEKIQADAIPTLQGMQARQIAQKQGLQARAAAPQAYAAIFKQLFPQMPPNQLAAVSSNPDIAEKIFPGIGAIIEKQLQMQIQKEGLDVNRERLKAETANQEETRKQAGDKEQLEAVKDYGKMGILDRNILHRDTAKALREAGGLDSHPLIAPKIGQTVVHPSGAKITRHK